MHIKNIFLLFSSCLIAFATCLFLVSKIAIDEITGHHQFSYELIINSNFAIFCAIMIVSYPLLIFFLFLLRKRITKHEEDLDTREFKRVYNISRIIPTSLSIIAIFLTLSYLFIGYFTWQQTTIYIISLLLIFTSSLTILKNSLARNSISTIYLLLILYTIFAITLPIFISIKVAPPWRPGQLASDIRKEADLYRIDNSIRNYANLSNKLPGKLGDLQDVNNIDTNKFDYSHTTNIYKLCTTFQLDSKTLGSISYLESARFYHNTGYTCFTNKFEFYIPKDPEPLSCKTLNGQMISISPNFGYIGCDMEVTSGLIDLSESYCEGQTTRTKEYLVNDTYGRKNRYWTTLQTTNPKEEVKVFAYSQTGEKVECLPSLNR